MLDFFPVFGQNPDVQLSSSFDTEAFGLSSETFSVINLIRKKQEPVFLFGPDFPDLKSNLHLFRQIGPGAPTKILIKNCISQWPSDEPKMYVMVRSSFSNKKNQQISVFTRPKNVAIPGPFSDQNWITDEFYLRPKSGSRMHYLVLVGSLIIIQRTKSGASGKLPNSIWIRNEKYSSRFSPIRFSF